MDAQKAAKIINTMNDKKKRSHHTAFRRDVRVQDPVPNILQRKYWSLLTTNLNDYNEYNKKFLTEQRRKKAKWSKEYYEHGEDNNTDRKRKRRKPGDIEMRFTPLEYDLFAILTETKSL